MQVHGSSARLVAVESRWVMTATTVGECVRKDKENRVAFSDVADGGSSEGLFRHFIKLGPCRQLHGLRRHCTAPSYSNGGCQSARKLPSFMNS